MSRAIGGSAVAIPPGEEGDHEDDAQEQPQAEVVATT